MNWILAHQPQLQSYALLATFACMAVWESLSPRRIAAMSLGVRWFNHIALTAIGYSLANLCLPVAAFAMAVLAEQEGWGIFALAGAPSWVAVIAGILALDLAGYALHRAFHGVPVLWRLHQVHHSDLDVDCGTAIRHHPVETLIAGVFDLALIVALGVPPFAVLISATLTGIANVFNHGNVALPHAADALLRQVVVTPDMHRIHHSVDAIEGNRNFSMLFSWWDRVFSTYVGEPRLGHERMELGVAEARSPGDVTLWRLLLSPFRSVRVAVMGGA